MEAVWDDLADSRSVRAPSPTDAIVPSVALVLLIGGSILLFALDALDGTIQATMVLSAMVADLVAVKNEHSWVEVQRAGQSALESTTSAQSILVGLVGIAVMRGVSPAITAGFHGRGVGRPDSA